MLADNLARRDINRGDAASYPEGLGRAAAGEEIAPLLRGLSGLIVMRLQLSITGSTKS